MISSIFLIFLTSFCITLSYFVGPSNPKVNKGYPEVIKIEVPENKIELNNHIVSIPCPICGMGETGTHNHYGGRACTSCRAFFRRSVQTNSYKVNSDN